MKGIDEEFERVYEKAIIKNHVFALYKHGILFMCSVGNAGVTAHPITHPDQRGLEAVAAAKEGIAFFKRKGIHRLQTRAIKDLKHARVFNRLAGLKPFNHDDKYIYYELLL